MSDNAQSIFTNPSVDGPQFPFGNGEADGSSPALDPTLPAVPGPTSAWDLLQWHQGQYLNPASMTTGNPGTYDPLYGDALYSWQTPGGNLSFDVYAAGSGQGYVYGLKESNGALTPAGGANLFLQTTTSSTSYTFNHPIDYSLAARVTEAGVSYDSPTDAESSAVFGEAFTGFIATFNAPGASYYNAALPTYTAFMQVGITNSMTGAGSNGQYLNVALGANGSGSLVYQNTLPGDPALAFQASGGQPQTLSYDLNNYFANMLASSGSELVSQAQNPALWALTGMYVGLETSNATASGNVEGAVDLGLQVSNVAVTTDASESYQLPGTTESGAPPAAGQPAAGPLFSFYDETKGTSGNVTGQVYTGPDPGLQAQYIDTSNDNVVIGAQEPDVFILGGTGEDALAVTSGKNVLSSEGASTWFVGGSGTDTFYVNADKTQPSWFSILNFHSGDDVTLWGFIPGQSSFAWAPSNGAAGYQGLTLQSESPSGIPAYITFPGVAFSDLPKIGTATGEIGGQNYLLIHQF